MKNETMTVTGRVNSKGQLMIGNVAEMGEFFRQWPDHRVTMEVRVYPKGSTRSQRGYYWRKIVPDCRQKFWEMGDPVTLKETDMRLRMDSPICSRPHNTEDGRVVEAVVPVESLSKFEMIQHIDHVRQYAAVNLGLHIEDPKFI